MGQLFCWLQGRTSGLSPRAGPMDPPEGYHLSAARACNFRQAPNPASGHVSTGPCSTVGLASHQVVGGRHPRAARLVVLRSSEYSITSSRRLAPTPLIYPAGSFRHFFRTQSVSVDGYFPINYLCDFFFSYHPPTKGECELSSNESTWPGRGFESVPVCGGHGAARR